MVNTKPSKIDNELKTLFNDVKIDRIKIGTDVKIQSDRRLSKAVARLIKTTPSMYDTLIKSPLDNDLKPRGRKLKFT